MSKDSPRTSVLRDDDLIQKGQDDLIRRGDALKALDWGDIYGRNAQDAINALPAVQPTVKPLAWLETVDGGETCLTDERYSISYWESEKLFVDRYTTMRRHPTLEAAKAAAQADYEARILSALDVQPTVSPELLATTNDVAALVEALENVIGEYDLFREAEYERGLAPLDDEIHEARTILALIEKGKTE